MSSLPVGTGIRNGSAAIVDQHQQRRAAVEDHGQHQDEARRPPRPAAASRPARAPISSEIVDAESSPTAAAASASATGIASARERGSRSTSTPAAAIAAASATIPSAKPATASVTVGKLAQPPASAGCEPMM